jgi:hypothetical protein
MEELVKLANVYAAKKHLSDDECVLYRNVMLYLSAQYRIALLVLKDQANTEGINDEELRSYS